MQPDSHDDLDQTDELPRLDVAAYEANLVSGGEDPLSRTDTWAVEALQRLELPEESDEAVPEPPTRLRDHKPIISGSADLTINVDRFLKRITELETNIAAARAANDELERRSQSLDGSHAELEQRVQLLQAENARLAEHSSISYERAQRLEQQLRDEFAQREASLRQIETSREADRLSSEQARMALKQQLEQKATLFVELQNGQARLRDELNESIELAASRAVTIAELQQSLAEEEDAAYGLGRNLAAKLAEYDTLSSAVAQRNATITLLQQARDELERQLQQAIAKSDALALQLTDTSQSAAQKAGQLSERDQQIEQRNQQLAALSAQIGQLTTDLQAASAARDELAARTAELESASAELDALRQEAAQIWNELEAQSSLAHTREEELASARQTIAGLRSARDELQRAVEEATGKIERLYAVSRDDTALLTAKNAELAALKAQLEEQQPLIRSLEQSIHARDTLVADLRNEVRTVQDERAIMAGQLDKARLRVKSIAQQLFQKDNRIATLKEDLAVHTEALAAIRRDINRVEGGPEALAEDHSERVLEPVDHEGDLIALNRKVMTIGRTNDNDIFIPSKMISRHHARLLVGPNAVIVEDTGSTNGCYVNDQQIKQHVLRDGDILTIGDLKFRLGICPPTDTRMRDNVIAFSEGRRNSD